MKSWDNIKSNIRSFDRMIIFALSFLLLFLVFLTNSLEAAIPLENININYKSGKISAVLKGVEARKALEDIAQKTGIMFVGLDEINWVIEDMEFFDLSFEEAIRKIGQKSIMIFRKEGTQKDEMNIQKVIILAQKMEEEKPEPMPAAPPVVQEPPQPSPPVKTAPPSSTVTEQIEKPTILKPATPPPPKPEPAPLQKPVAEPVKQPPKPVVKDSPKTTDDNLAKGLKYFEEKRWDLSVKHLKLYLDANPDDKTAQDKMSWAQNNANEAIRLYKLAKSSENSGDLNKALELYKTSYDIYPLLYDTWERIQGLKKKIK